MINKNLIAILFFVFLTACSGGNRAESSSANASNPARLATPEKSVNGENPAASQLSNEGGKNQTAPTAVERKIIRNAELTLEANTPEEVQQKVTAIAENKGGFVVESQQRSSSSEVKTRDTVTMTIRIPAEKFNESLDEIRKTASRVVVESVKGQDVTEEFLDVEARLKTKKALEEQFLEIMKQGKTVADALSVQRELATVREEIEKIEGRKRFLENQASLSTIKLQIQTPNSLTPNSAGFFYKLGESISNGFNAALSFVLVFVTAAIALLPFLLLVVLPIYLLIRYLINRSKKQTLAREIVRNEEKENIKNV